MAKYWLEATVDAVTHEIRFMDVGPGFVKLDGSISEIRFHVSKQLGAYTTSGLTGEVVYGFDETLSSDGYVSPLTLVSSGDEYTTYKWVVPFAFFANETWAYFAVRFKRMSGSNVVGRWTSKLKKVYVSPALTGEIAAPTSDVEDLLASLRTQVNEVFTYRDGLTSSDDLNGLRNPGYYWLESGGCINGVNTNQARILVFNRSNSSTAFTQIWIDIVTARLYTRTGRNVDGSIVWTDWAAGGDHSSLTFRPNLTADDDMDNVLEPGYYYKPNNVTVANGVNSLPARILVLNQKTATIGMTQIWIDTASNTLYLRTARAPEQGYGWSEWSAGGDADAMTYRGALTDGDDMNDLRKPGYYFKDAGIEVANGINTDAARVVVINRNDSWYGLVQLWIEFGNNRLYLRTNRNTTRASWTDWAPAGDPTAMVYRGSLPDGASVDDANQPGTYFKDAGVELIDGVNSNAARIFNFARNNALYALVQLWFDARTNSIYLRSTRNVNKYGWSDFAKLATVGRVAAMIAGDVSAEDSVAAFLELENSKAKALGANDTTVKVPSGLNWRTTSTALNLAKIAVAADANPTLSSIWGVNSHTITTRNASPRTITVNTTVKDETLERAYTLLGGKTGHLDASSTHEEVCNLMAVCRKNGVKVAGAIMGATSTADRFTAMKELMDAAYDVIENGSTSKTVTSAQYAAAIRIDTGATVYTQDANVEYQTASTIKTLTVLTVLDYIDDLDEVCTIDGEDVTGGSGNVFNAGDMVTIRDLIYAAMLPSSNTAAMALAHYVGAKLTSRHYADADETEARFAALEARVAALENT